MPDPPMMPSTAVVMTCYPRVTLTHSTCGMAIRNPRSRGTSMPTASELEKRRSIIDACQRMNTLGINQGTSGNISLRHGAGMLITPTSVPYEEMRPEQIVLMNLDGAFNPGQRPSSEWRFHRDILKARPEAQAVVHAHPPYATTLAIMGR